MSNYIQDAATAFQKLLSVKYKIVLGRKDKSISIDLTFSEDNFYHLSGFQHFKGYHFNKIRREKFYKDVLSGTINDSTVDNYSSNKAVLERVRALIQLENLIDGNNAEFFQYDKQRVRFFSNLDANYVIKNSLNDVDFILSFLVQRETRKKAALTYNFNSIFPLTSYDFTEKQMRYSVLLKEKYIKGTKETLFNHPNYNCN